MKTISGVLVVWLTLFAAVSTTIAQKSNENEQDRYGYFLTDHKKKLKIPFEVHSNLIIVPVQVNGGDTLRFILDTGVSTTIITEPAALRPENLRYTRKVSISGAGEGSAVEAHIAIGNTINMYGMRANHQNMVVLESDVLQLSEFVGIPVHGIFGYEIFNNFVVTIDFQHKELTLRVPGTYRFKKRHGDIYPITIEDTKPFTQAVTLLADGRERPIKLAIDTGAGHALLLDRSAGSHIELPQKVIYTQLGRGLNGVINGNLGRIEMIKVGRHTIGDVVASFPDSTSFGVKLPNHDERQGNIGCELLRRFRITMNYREEYMVMKPVKRRLREKFEHDMSGLEIRAGGEKFKDIFITHVLDKSPANVAGLQPGDQLMFLNNRPVQEMNISEVYKLLQRGHGKSVEMLVKRKGEVFFTQVVLRRLI
ncbi:hypothetical protein GCM10023091_41240 [Ravibacter arvi]|uniref:PDZ domain-containing protein n=1 Tax=Ravibacter arvi TaxID=2051041 RepID=A0ABP8MC64_9BACT